MNKSNLVSNLCVFSGTTAALRGLRGIQSNRLPILAYHRILDFDEDTFPADLELISANVDNFEKQVWYLQKHYEPTSFKQIIAADFNLKQFRKPPVVITFDDGFSDNYENAFPILKKYNVPATFFVTTDGIEKNIPFWFDLISYLVINHDDSAIHFLDEQLEIGDNIKSRRVAIESILFKLKQVSNLKRLEIINDLQSQMPYTEAYTSGNRNMTWTELGIMADAGMEIGSHSVTHPVLSKMEKPEIQHELAYSKKIIEDQLKTDCLTFSYPVGGISEYDAYTLEQIEKLGYKIACTYSTGLNKLKNLDKLQLQRVHVERYINFNRFKNSLVMPNLV